MALTFGAYTACLQDRSLEAALDVLTNAGLTGAEVNVGGFIPAPHCHVDLLLEDAGARAAYLRLFASRGMALTDGSIARKKHRRQSHRPGGLALKVNGYFTLTRPPPSGFGNSSESMVCSMHSRIVGCRAIGLSSGISTDSTIPPTSGSPTMVNWTTSLPASSGAA